MPYVVICLCLYVKCKSRREAEVGVVAEEAEEEVEVTTKKKADGLMGFGLWFAAFGLFFVFGSYRYRDDLGLST